MDLKIFPPPELEAVLRALRAVAIDNASFTEAEHDFVRSIARMHGSDVDPDRLEPITFDEVARIVVDPHRRKRVVQLAIVMALVEGDLEDSTARVVQSLASELEIPEQKLRVLYDMSHGHTMAARFEMVRRMQSFTKNVEGFPGFGKMLLSFAGLGGEDRVLAARYQA